jgi:phosphohistidine swiveling domain-containing protein
MISEAGAERIIKNTKWIIGTSRKMPFLVTDLVVKGYTQSPEFMKGFALRRLFYIYSDEFHKSYRDSKDMGLFIDKFKKLFGMKFDRFFEKYKKEAEYETELFNEINLFELKIEKMNDEQFFDFVKYCNINVPLGLRVLQFPVFVSILKEEGKIDLTENEILQLNEIRDKHAKAGWYFVDVIARLIIMRFASMFNLNEKQTECITLDEIIDSIKQNRLSVSSDDLNSRNKLLILIKSDNDRGLFTNETARGLKVLFNSTFFLESSILKGRGCFPGKLSGKIALVNDPRDLKNVKDGDIIATYMTTVHFTPYLKKIKGILTEEGGYSCHAVIVAREFKKPCIVGIKHLMNSIKNNDIVEMDADLGIVKIIEKAR